MEPFKSQTPSTTANLKKTNLLHFTICKLIISLIKNVSVDMSDNFNQSKVSCHCIDRGLLEINDTLHITKVTSGNLMILTRVSNPPKAGFN